MERVLKATPIVVCAGAVEADGVNMKRLGVIMEFLKDKQIFKEMGSE